MHGGGYDAVTKVALSEFTKDQRRRLEAFTAAKALTGSGTTVDSQLTIARYIETGITPMSTR